MTDTAELEQRIRARGVRVEERLRLLRLLRGSGPAAGTELDVGDERERHLRAIREAVRAVKDKL